jgi:rubrerythrin
MVTEPEKTQEALQMAIQMEIGGKKYYQQASQKSSNQLGRQLFQSLAAEEDVHRQKFDEIYGAIQSKKAWPKTGFEPDGGKRLRTLFAKTTEVMGAKVKAPATELDSVKMAMEMENKTLDFYKSQSRKASYDAEREFYEALAGEERAHHLVLLDYYEYLGDPAGWFVKKERPSLDGG